MTLLTPSGPVDGTMETKHRHITHIVMKMAGAPIQKKRKFILYFILKKYYYFFNIII